MVEQDFDNPRIWEEPKPFLRDFYVPFSVYDETFHTWELTKAPAPLDPCCTSCREPGDVISLCVYVPDESYLPTWEFIQSNLEAIESALKIKLAAIHARCLVELQEDNLPGMPVWQKHWEFILSQAVASSCKDLFADEEESNHRWALAFFEMSSNRVLNHLGKFGPGVALSSNPVP